MEFQKYCRFKERKKAQEIGKSYCEVVRNLGLVARYRTNEEGDLFIYPHLLQVRKLINRGIE